MTVDEIQRSSGTGALLAGGTILVLTGVAGIALYLALTVGGAAGQGADDGRAQEFLVWIATISLGVGALLLTVGGIRARRGPHTGS